MSRIVLAAALCAVGAFASQRSIIYDAMVARSGVKSNCSTFSSLFAADGTYESPAGEGLATGVAAIAAACEAFNARIGPQGRVTLSPQERAEESTAGLPYVDSSASYATSCKRAQFR